ncbi:class I SAM-dependent methyltransferase [Winogradskyella wichelsiae]|uniref:class I SAM-dependent methyltransferase n=1 Tax=Winogradskyella wichelsiae TaxID=2697007 RepID=UPI001FEA88FC|nr:class I SAM-dependent methyltransferase [Winogradskyella wichelsiae]
MKNPWPTKAVMEQIYDKKLWGGKDFDFYSGEGSHLTEITQPYLYSVISFLKSHDNDLVVCDLGCGDFNIGKNLTKYTKTYIAVDIVESLIERNKTLFKNENLEFHCLNIVEDELPKADCAIIRQVLQHLSNSEILKIVEKLKNYKYIILTEHLPIGDFEANKDKIASQGIRLKQNSGVDLLKAPFNLEIKKEKQLAETILKNSKIATKLQILQTTNL